MPVTTEIEPGIVLAGRYRVRERLGRGGVATVFLAEDQVLGREVAVKRLHTTGTAADAKRLRREARLGAALSHPNLVTVFDTISGEDGLLIVMEYVHGRPLSDLIGPTGMGMGSLLEVLRPVASALAHAHAQGVIHRDVKPANILIGDDGRVKLVDLGIATAKEMTRITAEHEVVGTLSYLAPERLAGESAGGPESDVYSLAVLAFEALSGEKPYQGETPAAVLERASLGPLPDLRESRPRTPRRLAKVIRRGMDRDPAKRQTSPEALLDELEEAAGTGPEAGAAPTEGAPALREGAAAGPIVRTEKPLVHAALRTWRLPLVPALLGLAALAAVVVGLSLWGEGGNEVGGGRPGGRAAGAGANASEPSEAAGGRASSTSISLHAGSGSGDPARGAELNEAGYALSQQGSYQRAVPILERAVASFPRGTTDINYAYALYNLAHALRMTGHPEEAIPILRRRLRIPDQSQTIQTELAAARADLGQ